MTYYNLCSYFLGNGFSKGILIEINIVAKDCTWTQPLDYEQVTFWCKSHFNIRHIAYYYLKADKSINEKRKKPTLWVGESKQHHLINEEDPILGPQLNVLNLPTTPPTPDVAEKEWHPPFPLRNDHSSSNLTLEVIKDPPLEVKVLALPNILHQAVAKQSHYIVEVIRSPSHRASWVDVVEVEDQFLPQPLSEKMQVEEKPPSNDVEMEPNEATLSP